ncbi:MAG: hypothetical protein HYW23_01655 [Candidatus Aenigmarchaeota archaeon]|nr:hypothetical protein [Candidatus Aenigmarchaeota archaeon]
MENVNIRSGTEPSYDVELYKNRILGSPGFKAKFISTVQDLRQNFLLSEQDFQSLKIVDKMLSIPLRAIFDLAVRCTSYDFGDKYGSQYREINVRQIMKEVEDLEYNPTTEEQLTPLQKEYLALWAEKKAEIYDAVKTFRRQLPEAAYKQQQKHELQEKMDDLFK